MQYHDSIWRNELKTNWIKNHRRIIVPLFSPRISELWILINISVVNICSTAVKLWRTNKWLHSFVNLLLWYYQLQFDVRLWFNQSLCTQLSHWSFIFLHMKKSHVSDYTKYKANICIFFLSEQEKFFLNSLIKLLCNKIFKLLLI